MHTVKYVKNFLFDKDIASIAPSSKFSVKKLCKKIDFKKKNVIVEYGPATGVFTFPILKKMTKDSKLIAIEKNKNFAKELRKVKDSRLVIEEECAQNVNKVLLKHGENNADYILSGIPISFFNKKEKENLMKKTYESLKPEGKFLVYQFNKQCEKYLEKQFDHVKKDFEILNIPPLSIFEAIKEGNNKASENN